MSIAAVHDEHGHTPVMRERMAELLAPAVEKLPGAVLIDATLGAGGHSEYFLQSFPELHVIGIDRDPHALKAARARLANFGSRLRIAQARFDEVGEVIDSGEGEAFELAREKGVGAGFFDLGVSSMQLDQPERGFAYAVDAPLDMRMNPEQTLTAAQILNTYSHGDLARILKVYGDERFAGKIASAIVRERQRQPFSTSAQLVELLYASIPAASRRTGGHPAKRTFQALRVEVNRELEAVENVIPAITARLRIGGRAVFMSYQSLEDRIVKKAFKELTTSSAPPGLIMDLPGSEPEFRLVTRGAEQASEAEIADNPRAAPVRVRAIERVANKHDPQTTV